MNIKQTKELLKGVVEDFVTTSHKYEDDIPLCNLMGDFHYGITHAISLLETAEEYEEKINK